MVSQFIFSAIPNIIFGPGKIKILTNQVRDQDKKILLITGKSTIKNNPVFSETLSAIDFRGSSVMHEIVEMEPTVPLIDSIVRKYFHLDVNLVIGCGGGSVIDSAKAIAAMLTVGGSIREYLEGFEDTKSHPGSHIRLIAIPTTAGTGSEATKNAVISKTGPGGFKRSLRHDHFIPDIIIIDPQLTTSCPAEITAASGMDAFTQLLESYVSTKANPITDSLAISGLKQISLALELAYKNGSDIEARIGMSYAALCSGITLANAGLGTVHGFASSVGGRYDIPHGVICGTLLASVTENTIKKLKANESNPAALAKYADTGKIFCNTDHKSSDYYIEYLISELYRLTGELKIPKLSQFGFERKEIKNISENTSCKNNPVIQNIDDLNSILESRF